MTTDIVWASCVFPVRNSPYTGLKQLSSKNAKTDGATYLRKLIVTSARLKANKYDACRNGLIHLPPKIVSTDLLPVLMISTRFLRS